MYSPQPQSPDCGHARLDSALWHHKFLDCKGIQQIYALDLANRYEAAKYEYTENVYNLRQSLTFTALEITNVL